MFMSIADQAGRERDDEQRQNRRQVGDDRRDGEDGSVGAGRRVVLLGEHLEAGDGRGERCPTAGPVRADARREEGDHLQLHEDDHEGRRHGEEQDRRRGEEEADDVDVRGDEVRADADQPRDEADLPARPAAGPSDRAQDQQRHDDLAGQRHALERPRDHRQGWLSRESNGAITCRPRP